MPLSARSPRSGPNRASKKSHAKRQPAGHIPRPRNAFILFRCDFVAQKKVPASVEHDHRNISRIAGRIWQGMSEADRMPWLNLAEQEKKKHKETYPGYRY
ncbi:HMG-box, partial [Artomyces pyxidatus]